MIFPVDMGLQCPLCLKSRAVVWRASKAKDRPGTGVVNRKIFATYMLSLVVVCGIGVRIRHRSEPVVVKAARDRDRVRSHATGLLSNVHWAASLYVARPECDSVPQFCTGFTCSRSSTGLWLAHPRCWGPKCCPRDRQRFSIINQENEGS
jgi:hypothetical protein